jgi:hypothetical protein
MIAFTEHADRLEVRWEGRPLCTYVTHDSDPAQLFRRPYLHPVYTLDGACVTDCRPTDHPWHKGISMTLSVVNDQNFWGGPTYRDGRYQHLENVGEVLHEGWTKLEAWQEGINIGQQLLWRTAAGAPWLKESRMISIDIVPLPYHSPHWCITWAMAFENISGQPLHLGSPATEGRANAGYTGLFWRGAPEFQQAVAGDSSDDSCDWPPDNYNGTAAPWLGLRYPGGNHPLKMSMMFENAQWAGVLPIKWFVRAQEYPGVAFSFTFDQPMTLEAGGRFTLRNRIYVTGGRASREPTTAAAPAPSSGDGGDDDDA